MIVVKPTSGQTKIKVTGLYQWDKFQILQFADEYPFGTEVHFAIKDETVALVYLLENGSVQIPSVLLESALPIMAWVHVGETTVLEIEMPVTPRAKPSDYISIEDDVQHSIEYRMIQLEQWQVEAINQMSDRYTKAEMDEKLSEKADKTYVNSQDALKADKTYVDSQDELKADKTYVDSQDALKADKLYVDEMLALKTNAATTYSKTEVDNLVSPKANRATTYTKVETDGLMNAVEARTETELNKKALATNGGALQTVTGKNKFYPLLSNISGQVIVRQIAAVGENDARTVGYGVGDAALYNNTGSYSNGVGQQALYNNTGSYSNGVGYAALYNNTRSYSNGMGYAALYNNTGSYSNGVGHGSLYNNTGSSCNGVGYAALYNNTGSYSNGVGYEALYNNEGDNNTGVGHSIMKEFSRDNSTAAILDSSKIAELTDGLPFLGHDWGSAGSKRRQVRCVSTTGTLPGGLALNTAYWAEIIDANTVQLYSRPSATSPITISSIGSGEHTFVQQFVYSNYSCFGRGSAAHRSNMVALGDNSVDTVKMGGSVRTPASANATGVKGEMCWDANYLYICVGTNTWKRTPLSTW